LKRLGAHNDTATAVKGIEKIWKYPVSPGASHPFYKKGKYVPIFGHTADFSGTRDIFTP